MTELDLAEINKAEAERLGIGSEEFMRRHAEIMAEIDRIAERNRRKWEARQMLGCRDVMELLSVSESKAYGIIRKLNEELQAKGYIIIRGKVSRAFLRKKSMELKQPSKEELLQSIHPDMLLTRNFFKRIYAYEFTCPGFADQALAALEAAGCSRARQYYGDWMREYESKRDAELKEVACTQERCSADLLLATLGL